MVLKECPAYENCIRIHRDLHIGEPYREFSCYGCNCYKCYELGFEEGIKETVKKINEIEYYNNCFGKLKGE